MPLLSGALSTSWPLSLQERLQYLNMTQFYLQAFKMCDIYFMGTERIKAEKNWATLHFPPFWRWIHIELHLPTHCTLPVLPRVTLTTISDWKKSVKIGKEKKGWWKEHEKVNYHMRTGVKKPDCYREKVTHRGTSHTKVTRHHRPWKSHEGHTTKNGALKNVIEHSSAAQRSVRGKW